MCMIRIGSVISRTRKDARGVDVEKKTFVQQTPSTNSNT